jgi:ribosomal protein S27E
MPKEETALKKGRWLSIPCSQCGAVIEIHGKWSAQTIRCPTCTSSLVLPARDHPDLKEITCQWCATTTAFFGQRQVATLNCPKCRADIPNVPDESPGTDPDPAPQKNAAPEAASEVPAVSIGGDPVPAPAALPVSDAEKIVESSKEIKTEPSSKAEVSPKEEVSEPIKPAVRRKRSLLERWRRATRLTQLHGQRRKEARNRTASAVSPAPPPAPKPASEPAKAVESDEKLELLGKPLSLADGVPALPVSLDLVPPPASEEKALVPVEKPALPTSERVPDLMREPSSIPLNLPLPMELAVEPLPVIVPEGGLLPVVSGEPTGKGPAEKKEEEPKPEGVSTPKPEVVPAVATRKSQAVLPWMMGFLLLLLACAGIGGGWYYVRHEKMSKNGFSQWQDFLVYQGARQLLDSGDTAGALSRMELRCGDPLADDALRAFYTELAVASGRDPLSLPEISLLIRNRRLSTEGTSRILLWEAARQGSPEVRMDAIAALIELRSARVMEPLGRFLEPLLGQQPNDVLGARPDGLAGYEWDIAATRWQALRVRLGDTSAAYTLRRWGAPAEPNRVRREAAIIETLRLGDEAARSSALEMFSDVTTAIEFRVDVADRLGLGETSGPLRDQIRSWATKGLGETIAKTYGLVFSQGDPKGLVRLETALRAGSLYGYLATAAAAELVDIRGTSATQALTDAKIYWSQELARLQGEAATSSADENSTLQQIARTVIQGLDLQMARAGDATQRTRFTRELDSATSFEQVRLALLWGEQGLESARSVLVHIADGGNAELPVSMEERERAMRLLLKTAPKELHSFLESALTRASAEHRYRAALRLFTLAREL